MARDKTDDSNFFWQTKYGRDTRYNEQLVDITDAYANELKMVISFLHIPSGKTVFFKGFITDYSETFANDWKGETVYGRTDPIYRYGGTRRQVKLSFDVPAASESEAYENMGRIQRLVQFQYPSYFSSGAPNQTEYTIGQSPLIRIKALNLIQKASDQASGLGKEFTLGSTNQKKKIFDNYVSSPLPEKGLLSAITNLSYNIEIGKAALFEKAANTVLPQIYKVTLDFAVIHEQTNGWDEEGEFLNKNLPYGADMYVNSGKTLAADASYAKRIQFERDNQAAADIAKSKFSGAFSKIRRRKAVRKSMKDGATDYERAMGDQAMQSIADEHGDDQNAMADEIAKINK
tara:strand:- start:3727 stop:4764 length:1038 start_codon:yes stop_codon:yes gene_type:complete